MKSTTLTPRTRPQVPAIRIGRSETAAERRYGTWLVWFMRALSAGWMVQGLLPWALVLLGTGDPRGPLAGLSSLSSGAVIVFAVLDLIAAVGLWLATAWGGVVWLTAVAAQWFAAAIIPGLFPYDVPLSVLDVLLVAGYFSLTYRAAQELEQ